MSMWGLDSMGTFRENPFLSQREKGGQKVKEEVVKAQAHADTDTVTDADTPPPTSPKHTHTHTHTHIHKHTKTYYQQQK